MAFGRTLAMFDAMLGYVLITSPFGGGEGDASSGTRTRSSIGADEPGAFGKISGMASHARVLGLEHVTPDIRDLVDGSFDPLKQHERG